MELRANSLSTSLSSTPSPPTAPRTIDYRNGTVVSDPPSWESSLQVGTLPVGTLTTDHECSVGVSRGRTADLPVVGGKWNLKNLRDTTVCRGDKTQRTEHTRDLTPSWVQKGETQSTPGIWFTILFWSSKTLTRWTVPQSCNGTWSTLRSPFNELERLEVPC